MSELLVSEQTFFEKTAACKEAILEILNAVDSNATLGLNDHMSEVASTFKRSYGLFYNAIREAVRILYVDWNVIEVCVTNMIVYDGYLSSMINGDSTAANYHAIGCGNLFTNMHAYDVDLDGSEINEARLPTYRSTDSWSITGGNIERIDNMRSGLDGFIDVCDDYLTVLTDYKDTGCVQGYLADAITRYLDNVHVRLMEYLKSVAQEFNDAMNQYCVSYFAEFPESGYILFRSELTSDVESLDAINATYTAIIAAARSTISSSYRDITGPALRAPYNPLLINCAYPNAFIGHVQTSRNTIQSVINLVDELEATGRALADSAEEYIVGLRASLTYIEPMGGFRLLHYHSSGVTDILDVPNVEDVTEIDVQEAVYTTESDYLIYNIQNADASGLQDEIDAARTFLLSQLPEGMTLSNEAILQWVEYYQHLLEEFDPETAQRLAIFALAGNMELLMSGEFDLLDELIVMDPNYVTDQMVYFVDRVATEDNWGYELNAWGNGSRDEAPDLDAPGEIDCSHLVLRACQFAGIDISACSYTGDMHNLEDQGFTMYACSSGYVTEEHELISIPGDLQPGDILLNEDHHAAMYVGDGQIVEAVHNEYGSGHYSGGSEGDTGMEVSGSEEVVRRDYHDYGNGGWHYVLRYTGA